MENKNYSTAVQLAALADWQINASQKTYLLVKDKLRLYVAAMQKAVLQSEASRQRALNEEDKRFTAELAALRERMLEKPSAQATQERDNAVRACQNAQQRAHNEADGKIKRISFRSDNLITRIVGSVISKKDADQLAKLVYGKKQVAREDMAVAHALERVREKAQKVMDAKIKLYNRQYEEEKRRISAAYELKRRNVENEYQNELATIVGGYQKEFEQYFNNKTFTAAYGLIRNTMRSAIGYSCSDKIPGRLYLGDRTFVIKSENGEFVPQIISMFRNVGHSAVYASGSTIRITLPFFRTMEEGYSLFLDVTGTDLNTSDQVLWDYVMKVLMNFPAGQTRPLLLDCDSTTKLTDFKDIGESSGKNIITKPWVSEKDITTELEKLSEENTKLTLSYTSDVASRMEREPIYVVACRNFPRSINPAAMTAMRKIMSAGSSRGFFGILQASAKELELQNGRGDFASSLKTIKENCLCLEETKNGYLIGEDTFVFEDMKAYQMNKQNIFSHLITGMSNYRRQVEKFEHLFSRDAGNVDRMDMHDINTWYCGNCSQGMEVPIGISGARTVEKYKIGGVAQHGLISGVTGSGKSTLLKTIIVAAMMKYTPENLNLYLVDFKEGVEFATFSEYQLPWIKTIALNTQRVFALSILQELQTEFRERARVMREEAVSHIKGAGTKFPRLLLVFDEVQALLSIDDDITKQCVNILAELVSEGRAMNINVIMASQNFSICRGINELKANMVLRIAMKGSPESARIVMGEDFSVDQLEQGDSGSAAINSASGARGQTKFFQVGYMEESEMKMLLSQLEMCWRDQDVKTRIMSIHVNQDRSAKFNRLIAKGEVTYNAVPENYELMLGDEFSVNEKRKINIGTQPGENLAVIGPDEDTAKSIFALSMLSVLYGELASRAVDAGNELIRLVDMSDDGLMNAEYLGEIAARFPRQIKRIGARQVPDMISNTYKMLQERKRGKADKSERLFLMLFGMDSLQALKPGMAGEDDGDLSLNQKLQQILKDGPALGINCILWTRSYQGFKSVLEFKHLNQCFNKRIYFGEDADAETVLGIARSMKELEEKSVYYRDMDKAVPNTFRVFELPTTEWLESVKNAYQKFEHKA